MTKPNPFWSLVFEMQRKHGTLLAAKFCALKGVPVRVAREELAKSQGQNVPVC